MFGECHGHIFMDGISYPDAVARHCLKPDESYIREVLSAYKQKGITFFRDGGDYLNVSLLAKQLAPEYDIDYRTPIFALHKEGYYGSIVGLTFSDSHDFCELVDLAASKDCDFIKLMVSGILSYDHYGELSCPSLPAAEIKELIHIVHEKGFAIMIHVNDDASCRACIEAGADSIEHGFFMSHETLDLLAASDTIWVPTISPSYAATGSDRFPDEVLLKITDSQMEHVRYACHAGCKIAAGSDAGAYRVLHGDGIAMELELLRKCGVSVERLQNSENLIKGNFKHN